MKQYDLQLYPYTNEILLSEANKFAHGAITTPVNKWSIPPSGDIHDYFSKPPYINTGVYANDAYSEYFDFNRLLKYSQGIYCLSYCYNIYKSKLYSDKILEILKAWFVNDVTKMTPHLKWSEAGDMVGSIDWRNATSMFLYALNSISKDIPSSDYIVIKQWFTNYCNYLTSIASKVKFSSRNNIYTYLCNQIADIKNSFVIPPMNPMYAYTECRNEFIAQVNSDGYYPLEIVRPNAFNYSIMNAIAFMRLATISKANGFQIHNSVIINRSFRKQFDVLANVIKGQLIWKYNQQNKDIQSDTYMLLLITTFKRLYYDLYGVLLPQTNSIRFS